MRLHRLLYVSYIVFYICMVSSHYLTNPALFSLVLCMWRQRFIETISPKQPVRHLKALSLK